MARVQRFCMANASATVGTFTHVSHIPSMPSDDAGFSSRFSQNTDDPRVTSMRDARHHIPPG